MRRCWKQFWLKRKIRRRMDQLDDEGLRFAMIECLGGKLTPQDQREKAKNGRHWMRLVYAGYGACKLLGNKPKLYA